MNRGVIESELKTRELVGTRGFRAPELFQGPNRELCAVQDMFTVDIWAAGVTLYSIVAKRYPLFDADTDYSKEFLQVKDMLNGNSVSARLTAAEPTEEGLRQLYIKVAKVIEGCLVFDPMKRISATEALEMLER